MIEPFSFYHWCALQSGEQHILNMAQRFYFDTCVFEGAFETEFEEETLLLFKKVNLGRLFAFIQS